LCVDVIAAAIDVVGATPAAVAVRPICRATNGRKPESWEDHSFKSARCFPCSGIR
jgi:hypothetical protein